ncbi:class F sortase [Streptomyces sp. NPDC002888]|uniref:class F sortase n=1 Tax=Streptomyces sp. NPDC002888 TaxID=3364668 RepID=UPI0036A677FA
MTTPTEPTPAPAAEQASSSRLTVMCAVAALALALTLLGSNDDTPTPTSQPPRAAPAAPTARETEEPAAPEQTGKHLPRAKPLRLRIPKIGVDAPFTGLSIGSDGQLEAPPADDTNLVGWHAEGASPGETGTSIIAGHVDTKTSAAVFVNLGELKKGDTFYVTRADRRRATFLIDSVETFEKDRFPSKRVYGDTSRAQARLITCAGNYDRSVRDYTDNLVVFAHLI